MEFGWWNLDFELFRLCEKVKKSTNECWTLKKFGD